MSIKEFLEKLEEAIEKRSDSYDRQIEAVHDWECVAMYSGMKDGLEEALEIAKSLIDEDL